MIDTDDTDIHASAKGGVPSPLKASRNIAPNLSGLEKSAFFPSLTKPAGKNCNRSGTFQKGHSFFDMIAGHHQWFGMPFDITTQ